MVPLLLAFFLMVLPLAHPQVASSSVPCERRLRPSVSRLNWDRKPWNYGYRATVKPIYVDYLVLSTSSNLISISVLLKIKSCLYSVRYNERSTGKGRQIQRYIYHLLVGPLTICYNKWLRKTTAKPSEQNIFFYEDFFLLTLMISSF